MPDRVLVTGISGYIAGHTALQLLDAGYIIRGSVRDLKKSDKVRATLAKHGADTTRLEFVALDLSSDKGWKEAMQDVRYVQHIASPFVLVMPRDKNDLIRPAVEGATRALEAAFTSDVERVVLTASMSGMMYGHGKTRTAPIGPADWSNLESPDVNAYIESKTLSEKAAWALADRYGRTNDLVAINPGAVFGPLLDEDPGTTASMILRMLNGGAPVAPRMRLIIVDVRDVAALNVAAMTSPSAGGRRFPIAGRTYSMMEIAEVLRARFPDRAKKLPKFELPDWFVRLLANVNKELKSNLCELGYHRTADSTDAKALLGRNLIPDDKTIIDTARSMIAQQLV